MRKLKRKYQKKYQKKFGMWCDCYKGRLPYPIECQSNKISPLGIIVKDGKVIQTHDRSMCVECERDVDFISWKNHEWDKVKEAIANREDLRNIPRPTKIRRA